MAVTRIFNNQITDSTITASKIATGTLTGNLFASSLTLNSNVTINGNLFLSNTGNVTTINATNTFINDPLVMFNNGYTGSLTGYDIGILVNRNLTALGAYGSVNMFLGWVEADSAFETLATTDTGTGVTSINNAGFANLKTGNTTMVSGNVTGTLSVTGATTLTTATTGGLQAVAIGNTTPGTAVFTTATTGGLQAVAIGNATPGSGAFTTGTFSSTLGVTGATTMTTATTGGLQAVAIGNVTPGSGAFTTLTASGATTLTNSTESTTAGSGALIVTGGVGIAKNLNVTGSATIGGNLTVTGTLTAIQSTTLDVSDLNITVAKGAVNAAAANGAGLTVDGASATLLYTNATDTWNFNKGIVGTSTTMNSGNIGGLQVVAIGNITPGSGAFTTGTFSSTLGVTGATTLTTASAGGIQAVAIGNSTPGTGAFTTLSASTWANITSTTAATSATTGALVVTGGVGIAGNVFHANSTIMNSAQTAGADTVIRGKNDATLLWARPNATYDTVIIGNSAVAGNVVNGAKLNIFTTDSILLPVGTTAQRPGSVGFTDVTGMFRFSTTAGAVEWYTGSAWQAATTSFTLIADQQFTGTGAQVDFTLTEAQTTNSCIVSINGVVQIPTLAYAVTGGTTLTFTEAPASGEVIDVRKLTTTATVTNITSSNGYMGVSTDNSGVYISTGTGAAATTTYWETGGGEVNSRANVTAGGTGDTLLDSFTNTVYSSGEYHITATMPGTNIRETAKILIVQDGTTATRVVYGVVCTAGNTLVTYSANISSGATRIYGTPTNSGTIFRVKKNYQAI